MHILPNDCEPFRGTDQTLCVYIWTCPKAEIHRGLQSCSVALSLLRHRVIFTPVSAGNCCLLMSTSQDPRVWQHKLLSSLGSGSLSISCSLICQIWARDEAWSRAFSREVSGAVGEIKSTDIGLCKVLRQRPAEGSDERHLGEPCQGRLPGGGDA